jgi:hypothetical protein
MILEIPSTSKAIPKSKTTNVPAWIGNARTIKDIIITIIPKPMLANRDFPESTTPLTIFSIPENNNNKPRKSTTDIEPIKGLISMIIAKIKITRPNPI